MTAKQEIMSHYALCNPKKLFLIILLLESLTEERAKKILEETKKEVI